MRKRGNGLDRAATIGDSNIASGEIESSPPERVHLMHALEPCAAAAVTLGPRNHMTQSYVILNRGDCLHFLDIQVRVIWSCRMITECATETVREKERVESFN